MNIEEYHGYGIKPMVRWLNEIDTDRKEEFDRYVVKYLKDHSNINERRKARFKKLAAIRYAEIITSQDVVERRKYVERLKFVEKQLEEKLKTVRQKIQYLS